MLALAPDASIAPCAVQIAFSASQFVVAARASSSVTALGVSVTRQRASLPLSMRLTCASVPPVTLRLASTFSGVRSAGSGANASSKLTFVPPSWLAGTSTKVAATVSPWLRSWLAA